MKILVAIGLYDYGVKERGYSYEYYNIYLPICDIFGSENIFLFDFLSLFNEKGKHKMNAYLEEIIIKENIDLFLCCPTENQFIENTLQKIRTYCRSCVYFFDDSWRQKFVRHIIQYFDFFSTPDYYMYQQYISEGIKNVFYSPFGFNKNIYKKMDLPMKYDISFVGGFSPLRSWIIDILKKEGLQVNVFGRGWKNEYDWVSQEQMVEIFNQSKINLNLSNSTNFEISYLLWSMKSIRNFKNLINTQKNKEQVKARHYEINGCGGFQISYFVPSLNLSYEIDKEIFVFEKQSLLAGYCNFFLKNDTLRHSIANQGYEKSILKHTNQEYLKQLITKIQSAA
jgi:spore maturation protein CgeB